MLAEIYLLKLEELVRVHPQNSTASTSTRDPRFVPVTLPQRS